MMASLPSFYVRCPGCDNLVEVVARVRSVTNLGSSVRVELVADDTKHTCPGQRIFKPTP